MPENIRLQAQLGADGGTWTRTPSPTMDFEIVAFAKAIESGKNMSNVSENISEAIAQIIDDFNNRIDMIEFQ